MLDRFLYPSLIYPQGKTCQERTPLVNDRIGNCWNTRPFQVGDRRIFITPAFVIDSGEKRAPALIKVIVFFEIRIVIRRVIANGLASIFFNAIGDHDKTARTMIDPGSIVVIPRQIDLEFVISSIARDVPRSKFHGVVISVVTARIIGIDHPAILSIGNRLVRRTEIVGWEGTETHVILRGLFRVQTICFLSDFGSFLSLIAAREMSDVIYRHLRGTGRIIRGDPVVIRSENRKRRNRRKSARRRIRGTRR